MLIRTHLSRLLSGLSMASGRQYSSLSHSPGNTAPVKSYPTDSNADPAGKSREKDDMVGLNDKFVRMIEKAKHLEDENKKLDTKLGILRAKEDYNGKIDEVVKQLANEMEEQIDNLVHDQNKLRAELLRNQEEVEDTKRNYEKEFQKKSDLEAEFVVLKKEVDAGHLEAVDLAMELEDLMGELDFLRVGYDEEIKELESQVQNETVILRDDSQRSLDMDEIVEGVKKQYALMATRSRVDAEHWNQSKMNTMVSSAGQREQEVRDLKRDISDTVRSIQRLNGDLDALRRKEESVKKEISDARLEGEKNQGQARQNIAQLEEAMRRAKHDLTRQIREYQELMNLKLALDIEIATYRKLLEGEEERMNDFLHQADARPPETTRPRGPAAVPPANPPSKKGVLIRVEVESGRVVSESSLQYTGGRGSPKVN